MDNKKDTILNAAKALTENYKKDELFMPKNGRNLPNRAAVIDLVKDLRSVIFPGYFCSDTAAGIFPEQFSTYCLNEYYDRLKEQVEIALLYARQEMKPEEAAEMSENICIHFIERLPEVQQKLLKMCRRVLTEIRRPKARKRSFFPIRAYLPSMYTGWRIFCIRTRYLISRES